MSVVGCDLQERDAVVPEGRVAVTLVTGGGALFVGNENARTRSGNVVHGCYAATPTATGGHDLSRARLQFPDDVLARAEGRQRVVMFMTDKPLGGETREPGLKQTVRCVVPDDDQAVRLAEAALGASGEPLWHAEESETARQSCQTVVVQVIWYRTCTGDGEDEYCGPWQRDVVTEEQCNGGGGGGPGGHDPCDEDALMPPADQQGLGCEYPSGGDGGLGGGTGPCDTGDEVIDDIAQDVEAQWNASDASNPDPFARREQGAFITRDPVSGQHRLVPFPSSWQRNACSVDLPSLVSLPPNTVGVFHTHPFAIGDAEDYVACKFETLSNGPLGSLLSNSELMQRAEVLAQAAPYGGQPSEADVGLLDRWRSQGADLFGVIADKDGYARYTADTDSRAPRGTLPNFAPCGYDPDAWFCYTR